MKQQGTFILFDTREEFSEWLMKQKVKRKISFIQNHHTWIPNYSHFNGLNHFNRLEAMRNSHMRDRGFSDVAQQLTTFPDGKIAYSTGRNFETTPAGISGKNTGAICIEHFGDFDVGRDKMTTEHKKTIVFLNAILCKWLNLIPNTNTIVYHHWFASKTCPGSGFFGGNKKSDAEKNFIPLVKDELGKLNSNVGKYEYNKVYKERIYAKNGNLLHAKDGDYSTFATDVRFIKFNTGKTKFRFVYETNAKNSELLKRYEADFSCNAPYFYEGKILGDTEINDKLISAAYGKMLKWHEFAVVDGVPTFGQLDKSERQDFLFQFAPLLVENGKSVFEKYIKIEEVNSDIANSRCQRTFSWTDKAGDLWVAVADGRTKYDQGLSLQEATLFAIEKGAWMCGNWDGGGSSILCQKGNGGINQKLNTGQNERVVHHALLFYIDENITKEQPKPTQSVIIPKIQREVNVYINKKKMSNGLLIDNTTFIPLRELGENLGSIIGWDSISRQASFNGIPVTSEDSYLINSLTYIKLRKFSELAGCVVDWNPKTYTATIIK